MRRRTKSIEMGCAINDSPDVLSSGNPLFGTEIGLRIVRNSAVAPRTFMFFNERLTSTPGYDKTKAMRGGRRRFVSRHPDNTTSKIFKVFLAAVMEMRAAMRLQLLENQTSLASKEKDMGINSVLDSDMDRNNITEIIGKISTKYGIQSTVRSYTHWIGG